MDPKPLIDELGPPSWHIDRQVLDAEGQPHTLTITRENGSPFLHVSYPSSLGFSVLGHVASPARRSTVTVRWDRGAYAVTEAALEEFGLPQVAGWAVDKFSRGTIQVTDSALDPAALLQLIPPVPDLVGEYLAAHPALMHLSSPTKEQPPMTAAPVPAASEPEPSGRVYYIPLESLWRATFVGDGPDKMLSLLRMKSTDLPFDLTAEQTHRAESPEMMCKMPALGVPSSGGVVICLGQSGSGKTALLAGIAAADPQAVRLAHVEPDAIGRLSLYEWGLAQHLAAFLDDDRANLVLVDSFRDFVYSGSGSTGRGGVNMSMYSQLTRLDLFLRMYGKLAIITLNPLENDEGRLSFHKEAAASSTAGVIFTNKARGDGQTTEVEYTITTRANGRRPVTGSLIVAREAAAPVSPTEAAPSDGPPAEFFSVRIPRTSFALLQNPLMTGDFR